MHPFIELTPAINPTSRSPLRRDVLLVVFGLACFALLPAARAVTPAPDGGYPNQNTAEGEDALFSLTTGINNTAMGFNALFSNTTGNYNTADGAYALRNNTTGSRDTAMGFHALFGNTSGQGNTAAGSEALINNTTGDDNTASGAQALFSNTTGLENTANGVQTLLNNTIGNSNTANGTEALSSNTTGNDNIAIGAVALINNTTGSNNIGLGVGGGGNLTTCNNNIDIGHSGVAGESAKIRIGTKGTHKNTYVAGIYGVSVARGIGVIVDSTGHLGTTTSSARFKEAIKPMDKASEAVLALQPMTFRYKHEIDPESIPQFGLVAEEVAKVNPDLVARDDQGKPYTVRYEAVNAMLLNEFLNEHRKVEALEAKMAQQNSSNAEQRKLIQTLAAELKEQKTQIRKVSAQLGANKSTPQLVVSTK